MVTPREIAALFVEMEQRLIASLKRNLSRHQKWEQEEGFSWPAWQAEKIRSLEGFRRQNRKILAEYRPVIDAATAKLLYDQYAEGYDEETEALEELLGPEPAKKAESLPKAPPGELQFFGTDQAKMDALIEDVNATFHKAESATFRMMDDVYRKTIYRAEMALSGGTDNIWKAVDMATEDFLKQGITCIRYKNGRLVNIASYAEMALRTAATRAKLRGEATKRRERGIDTVLVSQYADCSETCFPWQGRAYIDDVWGGFDGERDGRGRGLSNDGSWYPLLSVALEGGLFHPNCRHTLVDWKKGVTRKPETLDRETCLRNSRLEQRQRAMERKVRKYKRLQEGTLDPGKAKEYGRKVREAQGELRAFIREHGDVFSRKYQREKNRVPAATPTIPVGHGAGKIGDTNGDTVITAIEPIDFSDEKAVNRVVDDFGAAFSYASVEHAAVISPKGTVYHMQGMQSGVDTTLSGDDMLEGAVVVHNHPVPDGETFDDSFSLQDFVEAARSKSGREILFSGDRRQEFKLSRDLSPEKAQRIYETVQSRLRALAFDGKIKIEHEQLQIMQIISSLSEEVEFIEL